MNTITRWDQSRGLASFQDQINRLFEDNFTRDRSGHADMAAWAPLVDIYETENELVIKADLPDLDEKDIDVHVENNTLTIRGERNFEKDVNKDNYLRVERAYGSFMRSFSLPSTVNSENIRAEYRNGVLTLHMAKREESKPKQVKISVSANGKKFKSQLRRPGLQPRTDNQGGCHVCTQSFHAFEAEQCYVIHQVDREGHSSSAS